MRYRSARPSYPSWHDRGFSCGVGRRRHRFTHSTTVTPGPEFPATSPMNLCAGPYLPQRRQCPAAVAG